MDEKNQVTCIRTASSISWILGIIYILVFISILVPALVSDKIKLMEVLPLLLIMAVTFCIYCLSGWGLRKFFRWAGILSLCISGLSFLLSLLAISRGVNLNTLVSLIISGTIITLLVLGWKALK